MTIEVFFCERAGKLVRGVQVRWRKLPNGMVEYTASCPDHPSERLKKTDAAHTWTSTAMEVMSAPELDEPVMTLPANPGTVDEPSALFWEVFTKSVMAQLPEDQRESAIEWVVLAWQNELDVQKKQDMLNMFALTGKVQIGVPERKDPHRMISTAPATKNPSAPTSKAALKKIESEFIALDRKLRTSEVYMSGLIDVLGDMDIDAAREIDYDMFTVARIVGYNEYPKDTDRRAELIRLLEEAMGPGALSKLI